MIFIYFSLTLFFLFHFSPSHLFLFPPPPSTLHLPPSVHPSAPSFPLLPPLGMVLFSSSRVPLNMFHWLLLLDMFPFLPISLGLFHPLPSPPLPSSVSPSYLFPFIFFPLKYPPLSFRRPQSPLSPPYLCIVAPGRPHCINLN